MKTKKLSSRCIRIVSEALRMMRRYPSRYLQHDGIRPGLHSNTCNSPGCIAGFIHSAASKLKLGHPVNVCEMVTEENTAELLGVPEEAVTRFYHRGSWPMDKFPKATPTNFYRLPQGEKVDTAIARMRLWLKTNGKE